MLARTFVPARLRLACATAVFCGAILTLPAPRAQAVVTVSSGYSVSTYYSHANSDDIISYDWGSDGNLYYLTVDSSFLFGGFFQNSGSGLATLDPASSSRFPGATVLSIGDYVYYNDSDSSNNQFIRTYGPVGGTPTISATMVTNYSLHTYAGQMFITGAAGFGPNQIFHSGLAANGDLTDLPPTDLGTTGGGSGPLAFDLDGNLFFAPGFGDSSVYKWSAAEVAAAIAGTPLSLTGHLWADYSSLSTGGGTSMLVDSDGDLLVTITDFVNPALLVEFGVDGLGAYDGTSSIILTDTDRLGELRSRGGELYVSSGNSILQVVPEPSSALLALGGLGAVFLGRSRRRPAP